MTSSDALSTYAEDAERVYGLQRKACRLRDRRARENVDTRHVCLENIARSANASTATLRLLEWATREGTDTLVRALDLTEPGYIDFVKHDWERASRNHLVVESQFQIEAALRNVLLALARTPPSGFYFVARDALSAAEVDSPEDQLRLLNVPALMRNSLHTNGIHHGYKGTSSTETISGVEFRFDHGRPVTCGTWLHIVTALGASLKVVYRVFDAPRVRAIGLIPDRFAHEQRAKHRRHLAAKLRGEV